MASALALAILATAAADVVSTTPSRLVVAQEVNLLPGWTNVSRAIKPPAMAGAMMAYSSKDHRFVLFGGWDGSHGLNDTWVFDPENRTWSQLHPPLSPIARGDHMLVYDDREDAFVLFGGWYEFANATYVRLADTWTFSLAGGIWTERHPRRAPSARSDPQVAYDSATAAVLLFGGFNGSAYLGDTWAYTVANDSWTPRLSPLQPSPRADGRMAYVPSQDRFVLFGGNDYTGPNFTFHHLSDTWSYVWNSNVWTALSNSIGPPARDYPILAVDPAANAILLTSGYGNRTNLNDLWSFSLMNNAWSNITPAFSPPPRFAAAGGFDLLNNILVLFSGAGNNGLLADTWYYRSGSPAGTNSGLSPFVIIGLGAIVVVFLAVGLGFITLRLRQRR
jgi:Galactose oxidase, central domain